MTYELQFRTAATVEFAEAIRWYEGQRLGLGTRFRAAVSDTLRRIVSDPDSYPVVESEIRQAIVRKFPYSVLYLLESNRVVVLAVFHGSRDPEDWQSRIAETS
jgi:plasmid stabilization system protein ParE